MAQLRHRVHILFILQDKPRLLFHDTARFPGHALLLQAPFSSVRNLPGLFCQGCSRSVPPSSKPPTPVQNSSQPPVAGCQLSVRGHHAENMVYATKQTTE